MSYQVSLPPNSISTSSSKPSSTDIVKFPTATKKTDGLFRELVENNVVKDVVLSPMKHAESACKDIATAHEVRKEKKEEAWDEARKVTRTTSTTLLSEAEKLKERSDSEQAPSDDDMLRIKRVTEGGGELNSAALSAYSAIANLADKDFEEETKCAEKRLALQNEANEKALAQIGTTGEIVRAQEQHEVDLFLKGVKAKDEHDRTQADISIDYMKAKVEVHKELSDIETKMRQQKEAEKNAKRNAELEKKKQEDKHWTDKAAYKRDMVQTRGELSIKDKKADYEHSEKLAEEETKRIKDKQTHTENMFGPIMKAVTPIGK